MLDLNKLPPDVREIFEWPKTMISARKNFKHLLEDQRDLTEIEKNAVYYIFGKKESISDSELADDYRNDIIDKYGNMYSVLSKDFASTALIFANDIGLNLLPPDDPGYSIKTIDLYKSYDNKPIDMKISNYSPRIADSTIDIFSYVKDDKKMDYALQTLGSIYFMRYKIIDGIKKKLFDLSNEISNMAESAIDNMNRTFVEVDSLIKIDLGYVINSMEISK